MRIVLDAMGSDNAPSVEVAGAVMASHDTDAEITLVGDEVAITAELEQQDKHHNVQVVHASEHITMDDAPPLAVRKKKDSSLLVALRRLKHGEADAVVSAGNTGAVVIASRAMVGALEGVSRAAICQALPTMTGSVSILDLGANVNCTARHLCEFAEMGIAYSHFALGVEEPRVGLLNIGEEALKGTHVAKEVHRSLTAAPHVNFIGNMEPKALYSGAADVAVCDGFIGNLFLKTSEAVAGFMGKMIREEFEGSSMSKIGAVLARNALKSLKRRADPNEYPGAPLLGINGLVIILHGSVTAKGVANAIHGTIVAHDNKLNDHIQENIQELRVLEQAAPECKHAAEQA
ncbi:MAG: phosphate acyltransferase PlsX [Candidatus Hydrogenedentota bacterium]